MNAMNSSRKVKTKRPVSHALLSLMGNQNALTQDYLQRAVSALVENRVADAWELAQYAFRHDPSLRDDKYAVRLASEITGLACEDAVDELIWKNPPLLDNNISARKIKKYNKGIARSEKGFMYAVIFYLLVCSSPLLFAYLMQFLATGIAGLGRALAGLP